MVGSTYISDPRVWKSFYQNMIEGTLKYKKRSPRQVGGGIGNMYHHKRHIMPVSPPANDKPEHVIGTEVTPMAAIEERARSEFKDAVKEDAPRVPIKTKKRKIAVSTKGKAKGATSNKKRKSLLKMCI
ncbi:hypothetical protein KUTeg_012800 [Tegillarca granosa]|uniref:Uncharacterized protein n=2 Tax=Tegillarca granosa TaxID=220873 RepID=A0ABQ9F267_TEGGR|nr:hypothetical protein KUTeg_024379 [Tegillarca granosa]KAJ8309643.1 hypothetical protein KUTeg_012800 [Tegillarca granosa]